MEKIRIGDVYYDIKSIEKDNGFLTITFPDNPEILEFPEILEIYTSLKEKCAEVIGFTFIYSIVETEDETVIVLSDENISIEEIEVE